MKHANISSVTGRTRAAASVSLAGALILTACASAPERVEQLEQARTEVQTLSQDPSAQQAASAELAEARESLARADAAVKDGTREDVVHYAYLASRQAQAGQARIAASHAKARVAQAEAERNRVLLEARTREADRSQQQAQTARQEALSARAQAETTQQELAKLQAKQTERGMVLTLSDVLFDTDAATLKPGAEPALDRVARFMQENPETKVMIEGFTDSRGSESYNEQLSQRRAQAVSDALATRGVDRGRVETIGRGEALPVASNDTSGGRQRNRRVEIVFSDASGRFASGDTPIRR